MVVVRAEAGAFGFGFASRWTAGGSGFGPGEAILTGCGGGCGGGGVELERSRALPMLSKCDRRDETGFREVPSGPSGASEGAMVCIWVGDGLGSCRWGLAGVG